MKNCSYCKQNLSCNMFPKNKTTKDGLSYYCKSCAVKKTMESRNREKTINPLTGRTNYTKKYNEYAVNSKEYLRNIVLKNKYKITLKTYNEMLIMQNSKCAICTRHIDELPKTLDVDHCHTTGKVRGLLCGKCNMGIGYFQDNTETISRALTYLESHKV